MRLAITRLLNAIILGVLATLCMDVLNHAAAAVDIVSPVNHAIIGRLLSSWLQGEFAFETPADMPPVARAKLLGYVYHYTIGVTFSAMFLALHRWRAKTVTLIAAVAFGLATSVFSLFLAFPAMGLGPMGLATGTMEPLRMSLFNHLFYGLGLYLARWISIGREASQATRYDMESTAARAATSKNGPTRG